MRQTAYTISRQGGLVTIHRIWGQVAIATARANGRMIYESDRAARDAAVRFTGEGGAVRWDS